MEERIKHLYEDAFTLYARLAVTMNWSRDQLAAHEGDMEYCADVGFAMNEMDKLLKDIGVEVRKTRELAEKLACKTWMLEDTTGEPIRTEHTSATPDIKLQPALPKKGTPELAKLLDWLGVTQNQDTVRIHWPSLCDLVTQRVADGKPIPDCIDQSKMHNPSPKLKYYKRKDVME